MQTSATPHSVTKPITVTVQDARRLLGLGNTSIWKLISAGKLQTVRIGKRRLILYESIEELIASAGDAA
jgi:excisionase family DNA binding protein